MSKSKPKFKPLRTTFAFQITKSSVHIVDLEIDFCPECQLHHAYLDFGQGERNKNKWNFKSIFKE